MGVVAFKSRNSGLRTLLKVFKHHFDDLSTLRRYEPTLRRLLFLHTSPQDQSWSGEALHQLALLKRAEGNLEEAKKYCEQSLAAFPAHEYLGPARTRRDYGLILIEGRDAEAGLQQIKLAIALHDEDLKIAKGQKQRLKGERQRRITESYDWRARLLVSKRDKKARNSLIDFALADCRDCSLRDQQQVIEFLLPYVKSGAYRAQLDARLVEINTRRHKLSGAVISMAKLVIGIQLTVARRTIRTVIRIRKG